MPCILLRHARMANEANMNFYDPTDLAVGTMREPFRLDGIQQQETPQNFSRVLWCWQRGQGHSSVPAGAV